MDASEARSFLEWAGESPFEATLSVIAALVLVALFAGAKKVADTIVVGPNAVRAFVVAVGVLTLIVVLFLLNKPEYPDFCDQETMSWEEYKECRKYNGLPD